MLPDAPIILGETSVAIFDEVLYAMKISLTFEGTYKIWRYDPEFKSYTVLSIDQCSEDVKSAYFLVGYRNNLFIIGKSNYIRLDKFGNICQRWTVNHDD